MGLLDKFKEIMTDEEDDFDEYYDDSEPLFKRNRTKREKPSRERDVEPPSFSSDERVERPSRYQKPEKDSKVVNIHTTAKLQVVLSKPEAFEEARAIGDNLNARRTVVLNLETTSKDVARRILDFLSGVAYANNGDIQRVSNATYIITPYNVDVMGDLIDELESNGMFR